MWVTKTPQECEAAKAKQPKRTLVIWLGAMAFLLLSLFLNAGDSPVPGPLFRSFGAVMQILPGVIVFLVVATIIMVVFKIPFSCCKVVMMCPKCEAAKDDDGDYECSCGGRFVDIKTMKWVEEKTP
jgi:hypothetical protein